MDLSNSKSQAAKQAVLRAVAAKIAIVIGALGAVFYIALNQSDPQAAANSPGTQAAVRYLDTIPADPAAPAAQVSLAAVQGQPKSQRIPDYFPDSYVNQGKYESGNVMTYEHD